MAALLRRHRGATPASSAASDVMTVTGKPAVRYELQQQIGHGERAAVFHARDLRQGQAVVVKRFEPGRTPAPALNRLSATVETLRRAQQSGVVLPLALVTTAVQPLAVFTPLTGDSLEKLMLAPLAPSWSRAADIIARCAEILAATHEATGLSHRALKPSNIWLTPTGEVLVLDFGIAELGVTAVPPRDGPVFVEYRAPEQIDGDPGDARSDVFALAVLLSELTTGVHPFAGSSAFQVARQMLIWGPPSMPELTRGMSAAGAREAERLLTRALARTPTERFANVQEFLQALQFARRVIGNPATRSPAAAEVLQKPRPAVVLEDPTTMMQLPGPRALDRAAPRADVTAPSSPPTTHQAPPEPPTLQSPPLPLQFARPQDPSISEDRTIPLIPVQAAPMPLNERTEVLLSVPQPRPSRPLATVARGHNRTPPEAPRIDTSEEFRTIEFSRLVPSQESMPRLTRPESTFDGSDELPTGMHVASDPPPSRLSAVRPVVEDTLILPAGAGSDRPATPTREESSVIAPRFTTTLDRSHKTLLMLNVICAVLVLCGLVLIALL